MKNPITSLKYIVQLFVAASCVTCANATDTNVTHVNAEQAQKLVAEKKIVVVDLRTPEEFRAGHIKGATNINFRAADFEKALAALDKNQTYLLHCASGGRSTQALPEFQKQEFKSLYHLDGGLKAWQKAKLPVE
ncbi:MAG: rhodanese-like domain-containing protein [Verrucomicrobiales bacterium]|nr:MAG: rhodanese-like domain-containing protein [Verrucomicrobiales bacterium]